jgi:glyoxylase-like metal-dependent hydrolase (beta-lactamase superfamily II)
VSKPLQWKLFIRKRASATQGVPLGKDDLKWVANTTTLIYGEQEALLVDTFLSDAQTAELADWIAATGRRLSTIYITHAHPEGNLDVVHAAFKSGNEALAAVMRGETQFTLHGLTIASENPGKVIGLATTGDERSPLMPRRADFEGSRN